MTSVNFYTLDFKNVFMRITHDNGHTEELGTFSVEDLKTYGIVYDAVKDKREWESRKQR